MKLSGIYQITLLLDGRCYIGQSGDIGRRWSEHRKVLRANGNKNPKLQSAWNKYGESAFAFTILEECEPSQLTEREQWWMDRSVAELLNVAPAAGTTLGMKQTNEQRLARSERMKGQPQSRGYSISPQGRANISASHLGYKPTKQARANQSAAQRGRVISSETRRKISESLKARYDAGLPTGPRK